MSRNGLPLTMAEDSCKCVQDIVFMAGCVSIMNMMNGDESGLLIWQLVGQRSVTRHTTLVLGVTEYRLSY